MKKKRNSDINTIVENVRKGKWSGGNKFSLGTFEFGRRREIIQPYLHWLDERSLKNSLDSFYGNLSELKKTVEDICVKRNIIVNTDEVAIDIYSAYVEQKIPPYFIHDLFNWYYFDLNKVDLAARKPYNSFSYKLLEKLNHPVMRVLTGHYPLKSMIMVRSLLLQLFFSYALRKQRGHPNAEALFEQFKIAKGQSIEKGFNKEKKGQNQKNTDQTADSKEQINQSQAAPKSQEPGIDNSNDLSQGDSSEGSSDGSKGKQINEDLQPSGESKQEDGNEQNDDEGTSQTDNDDCSPSSQNQVNDERGNNNSTVSTVPNETQRDHQQPGEQSQSSGANDDIENIGDIDEGDEEFDGDEDQNDFEDDYDQDDDYEQGDDYDLDGEDFESFGQNNNQGSDSEEDWEDPEEDEFERHENSNSRTGDQFDDGNDNDSDSEFEDDLEAESEPVNDSFDGDNDEDLSNPVESGNSASSADPEPVTRKVIDDLLEELVNKTLGESEVMQFGEEIIQDAKVVMQDIDRVMTVDESTDAWKSLAQKSGPDLQEILSRTDKRVLQEISDELKNIKLNMTGVKQSIKKLLDRSLSYFSAREEQTFEHFFDAESIDGLQDYELLHPKIRVLFLDDLLVKEPRRAGKIDVYLDISISMREPSGLLDDQGNIITKAAFSKAVLLKLREMDMLNDLYVFNSNVYPRNNSLIDILSIQIRGSTSINNVLREIKRTEKNSLIITDAEDQCYLYDERAFFLGVYGAQFQYFDDEVKAKYALNNQWCIFDGKREYKVNADGFPIGINNKAKS